MQSFHEFPSKTSNSIAAIQRNISALKELAVAALGAWATIFGYAGVLGLSVDGLIHLLLK